MKKTILFTLMLVAAVMANAIPAKPGVVKLATSNGTTIEARLIGDEFHHNYVSADGYIVRQIEGTNFYELTDKKFVAADAELQRQSVMKQRGMKSLTPKNTKSGSTFSRGLVILVGFADKAFTESNANFTNLLNQNGYSYNGATGSARDYYRDCSYGAFDPQFDVYGPYQLDKNMSYYGSNIGGSDAHPDQMVVDAVAKLCAAEGDSILRQYDCDNDGYVDNVFVYYAGYAESSGAPSTTIWPHRWYVMSYYVTGKTTYAGKTIYDYACSSEYDGTSGAKRTGIGAFTHEFSHVLGLPDLYDTQYSQSHCTPDSWDIMDAGCYNNDENTPPAYSSEERFYVGWLTPTVLNTEMQGDYTLQCLSDTAQAYLICASGKHNLNGENPNPKNYYLFENRQKKGWDAYLPGHGMLVWKIQYSSNKWSGNTVNNNSNSLGCIVVSASNPTSTSYRSASAKDPFPGSKNVTYYSPISGYGLYDITESDSIISFTLGAAASVEDASEMGEIVMFSTDGEYYTVDNIPENATLRCYDSMGRLLWSAENVDETYTFSNGREVFFLQIQVGGKTTTLKGI